jgi:hypothetical protein
MFVQVFCSSGFVKNSINWLSPFSRLSLASNMCRSHVVCVKEKDGWTNRVKTNTVKYKNLVYVSEREIA